MWPPGFMSVSVYRLLIMLNIVKIEEGAKVKKKNPRVLTETRAEFLCLRVEVST